MVSWPRLSRVSENGFFEPGSPVLMSLHTMCFSSSSDSFSTAGKKDRDFFSLVWSIHPVFSTARLNLVTQQWLLPENAGMKPSAPHQACHSVVPVPLLVMFELAVWMKIDMFSLVRTALELRISCFVYLTPHLDPGSFSLHNNWKPNAFMYTGPEQDQVLLLKSSKPHPGVLIHSFEGITKCREQNSLYSPNKEKTTTKQHVYPRAVCPSWFSDFCAAPWPSSLELRQNEGYAKVLWLGNVQRYKCSFAPQHKCISSAPQAQKKSRSVQYLHLACLVLVCRYVYHFDLRF